MENKEIAKTMIIENYEMYLNGAFECPNCHHIIYVGDYGDFESHKYCLNCGQKLKYEENWK